MFLSEILHLVQPEIEPKSEFQARAIYSAVGRLALASLWDQNEEEDGISVVHFKKKLGNLLRAYLTLFPDTRELLCPDSDSSSLDEYGTFEDDWEKESFPDEDLKKVMDEIYSIYRGTGYFYHQPYRLSPAAEREASYGKVRLIRGGKLTRDFRMSGLGTWEEHPENKNSLAEVMDMFQIPRETHTEIFQELVQQTQWENLYLDGAEYLSWTPNKGYWKHQPDTDGRISLLRKNNQFQKIYWLYRFRDGKCEGCELPAWRTEDGEYLRIAASLLKERGKLPPIYFRNAGDLVFAKLNYLLPPAEQKFLKLWSWPHWGKNWEFHRSMSSELFRIFRQILESRGYRFNVEEK